MIVPPLVGIVTRLLGMVSERYIDIAKDGIPLMLLFDFNFKSIYFLTCLRLIVSAFAGTLLMCY
jgi:hypothetical protein